MSWGLSPSWFTDSSHFPGGSSSKEPTCQCRRCKRRGFDPWVGKIPWRGAWQPTPVFSPGESHGQGSLKGYVHRVAKNQTWLKWLSTHTWQEDERIGPTGENKLCRLLNFVQYHISLNNQMITLSCVNITHILAFSTLRRKNQKLSKFSSPWGDDLFSKKFHKMKQR